MISAAGLVACNPPAPTHDSGTCIDLVLTDEHSSLPVSVAHASGVDSDHRLLACSVPCSFRMPHLAGLSR
eukprot:6390536-Pyramimonas_sp.AAC.1